jgi:putative tricarboxylic transport membrane protein
MKVNDILIGILIGIFGIAVFSYAWTLPQMPGQDVGPGMFPRLIAGGFIICAILLIKGGIKAGQPGPWIRWAEEFRDIRNVLRFLLIPVVLVCYIEFSDYLGFIPISALLLLVLFLAFQVRFVMALTVAVLGTLCIHYLFYKLLEVPLPWGLLDSIAW